MRLTLALATSGGRNSLALGAGTRLLWRHDAPPPREGPPETLADCVTAGLRAVGAGTGDIAVIAVDIGPGGLGATRCGVAFANALGFGLDVPVCPLQSFAIMAAGVRAAGGAALPVVCLAPAADGQVYAGLSRGPDQPEALLFGAPETVVPELTRGLRHFATAGKARHRLPALRPDATLADSGIDGPAAAWMILLDPAAAAPLPAVGTLALPVTEHHPAVQARMTGAVS